MKALFKSLFPDFNSPKNSDIEHLRQQMLATREKQQEMAEQQGIETHQLDGLTIECMAQLTNNDETIKHAFKILLIESNLPINFKQAVQEYSDPSHTFHSAIQPIMDNIEKVNAALQRGINARSSNTPEINSAAPR